MNMKLYISLLMLSIVATVGGVLTLIPVAGASFPNVLGYRSLCTFAPAATLFCFSVAGTSCLIRASMVKRRAFSGGRVVVRTVPVVIVLMVLALAIGSTGWYSSVKNAYADAATHATSVE